MPPKPYRGPTIRRRGTSFEIRFYAGIDADGKKQNFYATVQGTGRKAEREAKQKEGELLAKAAGSGSCCGDHVRRVSLDGRTVLVSREQQR